MLLFDLFDPSSPANPEVKLGNPLELMMRNSFHGGVWRTAWVDLRSRPGFGDRADSAPLFRFMMDSVGDASAYLYLATPWNWPKEAMTALGIKSKL